MTVPNLVGEVGEAGAWLGVAEVLGRGTGTDLVGDGEALTPPLPGTDPGEDEVLTPPLPGTDPGEDEVLTAPVPGTDPGEDEVLTPPVPGTDLVGDGEALTPPLPGTDPGEDEVLTPGEGVAPEGSTAARSGAGIVTAAAPSAGGRWLRTAGSTWPMPGRARRGTHGARAKLAPTSTR